MTELKIISDNSLFDEPELIYNWLAKAIVLEDLEFDYDPFGNITKVFNNNPVEYQITIGRRDFSDYNDELLQLVEDVFHRIAVNSEKTKREHIVHCRPKLINGLQDKDVKFIFEWLSVKPS